MREVPVGADGISAAFDRLLAEFAGDADRPPGVQGPEADGEAVVSLTVDVSAVLRSGPEPVTVVRIAPRPPVDRAHELREGESSLSKARIVHVSGGHTNLGEELVPFDAAALRDIAANSRPGGRYVVTSVGSLVNSSHEIEAGRILLENAVPASVGYSHYFESGSFGTRERTAVINSSLIPVAESLATSLALAASVRLPHARLYAASNDGGCVPLTRLTVTPVHSMAAARAGELVGAAALSGIDSGRLAVVGSAGSFLGDMIDGVPAVRAKFQDAGGMLASKAAHVMPVPAVAPGRAPAYPVVAAPGYGEDLPGAHRAEVDLCALGAAVSPLAEWADRSVIIADADDIRQALSAAEARVRTRLVSFGASPSQVRIIDSRVVASTYQDPRVVSVRVRGVAGAVDDGLRGGERRAPHD
ncbi:hypothetical protein [Microbacterium capsulatum]|nr:hypothetical protein [Microbacterium sp. ASV81]